LPQGLPPENRPGSFWPRRFRQLEAPITSVADMDWAWMPGCADFADFIAR